MSSNNDPRIQTCIDIINEAGEIYNRCQSVCRSCVELNQSCIRCLELDDPDQDCGFICESARNCESDLLHDCTLVLRTIYTKYVTLGCRDLIVGFPNSLGPIPIYDACDPLIKPDLPPAPPPNELPKNKLPKNALPEQN